MTTLRFRLILKALLPVYVIAFSGLPSKITRKKKCLQVVTPDGGRRKKKRNVW